MKLIKEIKYFMFY